MSQLLLSRCRSNLFKFLKTIYPFFTNSTGTINVLIKEKSSHHIEGIVVQKHTIVDRNGHVTKICPYYNWPLLMKLLQEVHIFIL